MTDCGCDKGPATFSLSGLLLPVEAGGLHGRLAGVAQLLLPAREDLVSALQVLVRLGVLDHAIDQAHVTIGAGLPQLPRLLALTARDGTLLRPVLVAEGAAAGSQDHV